MSDPGVPGNVGAGTRHVPVLLSETIEALAPAPGKIFIDGTLGGGGHAGALLAAGARVIGLDWDERVLARTQPLQDRYGDALVRVQAGYGELAQVLERLNVSAVHGVLLDLGFSSDQLDDSSRGLSYHVDGPLDMRLDSRVQRTAADLLNEESETALARVIYEYGEEPKSRVLARMIVARRKLVPWQTTAQLLALVEEVYPARPGLNRAHPAARIFQALRVAVNNELQHIDDVLPVAARALMPGGRLAVITFQPAEDRLVKSAFRRLSVAELDMVGRQIAAAPYKSWKKIEPGRLELTENPRARSAKLRVLERVETGGGRR